jgi:hypothetical protein
MNKKNHSISITLAEVSGAMKLCGYRYDDGHRTEYFSKGSFIPPLYVLIEESKKYLEQASKKRKYGI